jgi:amino acid permease-like protein
MFPVDGGTARFPLYGFGRVTGFFSGWFAWISAVCVPPIETEAALRYVGNYVPSLIAQSPSAVRLTPLGQLVAAFVLLGFSALNAAGMRWLSETNTVVVWWKIAIPLIVAIAFIVHGFDRHNFAVGGLFPAGAHGVLAAISTGGVVFALLGFEQAVELGGEAKDPQRSVPWAVIGSVVIAGLRPPGRACRGYRLVGHRLPDLCGRHHLTVRIGHDVLRHGVPAPLCPRSRGLPACLARDPQSARRAVPELGSLLRHSAGRHHPAS